MEPAYLLLSAHRKSTHRVRKVGYRGKEWQKTHVHIFVKETV